MTRVLFAVFVGGCTLTTSLDGFTGDGGRTLPSHEHETAPPQENPLAPPQEGWAHRRTITVSSDAPDKLENHPVLVVLPPSFAYNRASPDGADLRISATEDRRDELPYFIESWQPGGTSFLWVLSPNVPPGTTTLHLFYGNKTAPPASRFEAVFPRARRTPGGGIGSFTATGDIDVDWFELRAGDTLTLAAGTPLAITARRIIVAGTVQGDGRGHAGGSVGDPNGKGPGGGKANEGAGGGGGGHAGAGGAGGSDDPGKGGAGGAVYGSDSDLTAELGSGGAGTQPTTGTFRQGGAGGGGIAMIGWRTTISGTITVNGLTGAGGASQNAGGGAGGTIVVAGSLLELAGAKLTAQGGAGGPTLEDVNDGGGGGGGGRIKLFARADGVFLPPLLANVDRGQGGVGAGTTAPGARGEPGRTHTDNALRALRGATATLAPE